LRDPFDDCALTDWGKALKFSLVAGFPTRAFARSGGGDSVAMESRSDQLPSACARSMAARSTFVMRRSASSRSIFLLLTADHALPGLRGIRRAIVRSASSLRGKLSIQLKQSAWSMASLSGTWRGPADFFQVTSQMLVVCVWMRCSHAHGSALEVTSTRG